MRVIAGSAKGRRLKAPKGEGTRPTSDRVREALFASLGPAVVDAVVLDLWAGTGALAIEALSRGARRAVLVERDRRALAALRANLTGLSFDDRAQIVAGDVAEFARRPRGGPFTLVLADPPYATPLPHVWGVLRDLVAAGGLDAGAQISVERARAESEPDASPPAPLALQATRSYGDTVLWRLRVAEGAG